ncbi:hypothetical protein KFL_006960020 [Klebsormidium nitens]|uniref:Uncharacterized protein n=1 Tax=Klebsormidium nitens TaxID=105231 RepID=A0A1Y1IQ40_KLENI|nr:hypothetical protein KFL_006960020 [Klebsormidium nitens]|eukprot:GAQ90876.1 hypothetical protein KFL_006960020 [Klebsormidium nitens]
MATRRALRSSQAASAAVGSKNGPKSGDAGVGKLFKLDSQRRDKIERNLDFFRAKPASSGSKGANWIPPKPPLSGSETRDEEVGAEGSEAQRPEASLAASTSKGKGLKRKLPDDFDAPVNNPTIIDQIQSKAPSPFPKAPPNTPAGSPFSPRSPNARGQPEPLANDPGKNLQNASRGAEHVLNASEKVRYEKAKIKIKELKAKNQILERTVKEQSQHILSLERSVASARDKLELPDFLQPQFLKTCRGLADPTEMKTRASSNPARMTRRKCSRASTIASPSRWPWEESTRRLCARARTCLRISSEWESCIGWVSK